MYFYPSLPIDILELAISGFSHTSLLLLRGVAKSGTKLVPGIPDNKRLPCLANGEYMKKLGKEMPGTTLHELIDWKWI